MSRIPGIIHGAALLAALALSASAAAQTPAAADSTQFTVVAGDTLWLAEPMDVLGTRVTAALPGIVRGVGTVDQDAIARLPGRSPAELLQAVPSVVVGQRQQYGVQGDLTIRGSSFEQVQVLLDGFDVGDPQTGHHLLDLPVGRGDLQRLEVLPGHGSVLYGMGAFGGTVNVVTRKPALPDTAGHPLVSGAEAAVTGGAGGRAEGGKGSWGAAGSADLALGQATGLRLSGERFRTDGHDVAQSGGGTVWAGNDADTWSTAGRLHHRSDRGEADLFAGYADRSFGARDFYAPYAGFETTHTLVTYARLQRAVSDRLTLEPRVFFRRHTDEFILVRDNPDLYTNDHISRQAGADLRAAVDAGRGQSVSISAEFGYEDIDSRGLRSGVWGEALGNHLRRRTAVAAELDGRSGRWRWQLGSRLERRTGLAARVAASGAVAFKATDALTLRASAGSVYRAPTFTELYYRDPANLGDPRLDAERGWTWDTGAEYYHGPWLLQAAWFERRENDLIEWARPVPAAGEAADPWQAMNVGEGRVQGGEIRAAWQAGRGHTLAVAYVGLDKTTSLPAGLEGKYALLTPEQQVILQGTLILETGLSATLLGRYLERSAGPDDFRHSFVLDGRLDWTHPAGWFLSLAGTNLLDRRYQEVPGVPMPGVLHTLTVGRRF